MKIISHRALIDGPDKNLENQPKQITRVIENHLLDIEVDVFVINNQLYLGHDEPNYLIDERFLKDFKKYLWIHCKNIEALKFFHKSDYNFFWHENDKFTITSKGIIWCYPSKILIPNTVCVMPELFNDWKSVNYSSCLGVCTDYPSHFLT